MRRLLIFLIAILLFVPFSSVFAAGKTMNDYYPTDLAEHWAIAMLYTS
jgi:ligand-binding sensor domain-containing protein